MAELQPKPDEDFHEETPQEFADQPDRAFARVRSPGAEPDGDQPEQTEQTEQTEDERIEDEQVEGE